RFVLQRMTTSWLLLMGIVVLSACCHVMSGFVAGRKRTTKECEPDSAFRGTGADDITSPWYLAKFLCVRVCVCVCVRKRNMKECEPDAAYRGTGADDITSPWYLAKFLCVRVCVCVCVRVCVSVVVSVWCA